MKIVFKSKSIIGMLIVFPIMMLGSVIFIAYGNKINTIFDIISYIVVIIIALMSISVIVVSFIDEDKNEDKSIKNKIVIKFIARLILVMTITFTILIIPEIREGLFMLLKIFYFLLAVVLIPMFINKLINS